MSRTDQFLAAKQQLRTHPDWTDAQVADAIGTPERDTPGMAAIAQARKDVIAGDHGAPHVRP